MQTYTLWSEAGGVGKTTLSVNLAAAHARRGYDVLVVDLDPQDAGLTDHVGAGEHKHDGEDNLVRHMIDKPRGPFADLVVETDEGFDLVPSHDTMARLGQLLRKAEEMAEQMDGDEPFDPSKRLFEVLQGYGVRSEYDILLVDCPATAGIHIQNALYATRNVLVPVEVSKKGDTSVAGLQSAVEDLRSALGIEIRVLGIVPNKMDPRTNVAEEFAESIESYDLRAPISFGRRKALFAGAWAATESVFAFQENQRDLRDHEVETRNKICYLADLVTDDVSLDDDVQPADYEPDYARPAADDVDGAGQASA